MVVNANGAVFDTRDKKTLTALDLIVVKLSAPLKRSVRLRDKDGAGDRNRDVAAPRLRDERTSEFKNPIGQIGYSDDVIIRLSGKPHHEIELHAVPAGFECRRRSIDEVVLGNVLVDDVAKTLAARLGSERKTALLFSGDGFGHIDPK